MTKRFFILPLLTLLLLGCVAVTPTPAEQASEAAAAPSTDTNDSAAEVDSNYTNGCVENFAETTDYFPSKITLDYATGMEVEYFNNYKVVTVTNPYRGAEESFQYVLVQCGTPAPAGFDAAQVIDVPVDEVIALSTTTLPGLIELDVVDSLVAVDEFDYVNSEPIRTLIDAGAISEVGGEMGINVELTLAAEPDLVFAFAYGSPEYDAHPKLLEADIPTAITAGYMEQTPLGRAEWIKFTALFYNEEAAAQEIFSETATRYEALAQTTADVDERPTVFTSTMFGDAWTVSGGDSYFAQLLADAGADYLWSDDDSTGGIPLDFESVFERAADAEIWLPNTSFWASLDDAVAADERYAEFAAFEQGNVYNNNAQVNEFGGNNYFEAGVTNPDLVLADLIKIFHPALLPDHELVFFQELE